MDHAAAGRRVAQHFIAHQFQHFAAVGIDDLIFSQRFTGFCEVIQEAGLAQPQRILVDRAVMRDYRKSATFIADALKALPRPLAVMAHNDRYANKIMHACWHHGFSVPAQVAICGFDNDPIACDLALVPLSSIDTNPEAQMEEATRLLSELMTKGRVGRKHVTIEPRKLVVRDSSGVVASKNLHVAKALAYIHQHAWSSDLSVPEIATELGISQTTLYAAFRAELSVTPLKYITALRIDKAKRLIKNARLKIGEVRSECGFSSDYQMYMAFKQATGKSPGGFRSRR
jgi:LacI family transcriptional regulator